MAKYTDGKQIIIIELGKISYQDRKELEEILSSLLTDYGVDNAILYQDKHIIKKT